ncbi:glycosyl transferase family 2 [Bacillaceae bacterium SAS-127]|nr:glycosyl transferase family 2 [Bacillaceae bacterium SAS-127]
MNPLVSIHCATYNHENYIADAIEGFMMQKTNFDFEVLIGEDCSTDRTREIVEKYIRLYPDHIRLITSEHNVGARKNLIRLHEQSRGKYIAFCEGDDYWLDPYKLQKQVDYMESHPECTFCFTNGEVADEKKQLQGRAVIPWLKHNEPYYYGKDHKYLAGELALLGYIPTASFLFPKHLMDGRPDWYFRVIVDDNSVKLITTSHGYAHFMDEKMCAYRFGLPNSATTRWNKDNNTVEKQIQHNQYFIDLYNYFNEYSNSQYEKDIDEVKKVFEFQIHILKGELYELKSERFKDLFDNLSTVEKAKIYSRCYFPRIYSTLQKVK